MAEPITIQKLIEASMDSDSLEVLVNGDENAQVTTRLGETYPSAKKAIKSLFENGGLPATPFASKALMTASALVDGKYAMVTDGGEDNGLYVKTAGAWVKSAYDPFTQAKAYTDTSKADTLLKVESSFDTKALMVASPLPNNSKALVDADPIKANNGFYKKVSNVWSKVAYKPEDAPVDYLANQITPVFEPVLVTTTRNSAFPPATLYNLRSDDPNNTTRGVELVLSAGDVLTFDYLQTDATILWEVNPVGNDYAILTHRSKGTRSTLSHTYVANRNVSVRISSSYVSTIRVNSLVPNNIVDLGYYAYIAITDGANLGAGTTAPEFSGFKFSNAITLNAGDVVKVTNAGKGHSPIISKSNLGNRYVQLCTIANDNLSVTEVSWVADKTIDVYLIAPASGEFYIKRKTVLDKYVDTKLKEEISSTNKNKNTFTGELVLKNPTTVFATHQNFILKTVIIDTVENIAISQDLGKTWTYVENILGDIVTVHFFTNGTIMLCSPTKVYWTDDYITLNESVVYDHNGNIFAPTGRHFQKLFNTDTTMFVDGKEIWAWGEYRISVAPVRVWFTSDFGRTIKCTILFNNTYIGGIRYTARHVHTVSQHKKSEVFYLATGDNDYDNYTENRIYKGVFDVTTDSFTWEVVASGGAFKITSILFDDIYAYIATDYTPELVITQKNGLYRVRVEDIGNINKWQPIYVVDDAEWGDIAPAYLFLDNNGNKLLLPDWIGQGKVWIAQGDVDFQMVTVSPKTLASYIGGPNYNGDFYCSTYDTPAQNANDLNLKLNRETYNITESFRDAGLTSFMANNPLSNNLQN